MSNDAIMNPKEAVRYVEKILSFEYAKSLLYKFDNAKSREEQEVIVREMEVDLLLRKLETKDDKPFF